MESASLEIFAYYTSGKPLVCDLEINPYRCEFWPHDELIKINMEYQVQKYAPGYFGFATSGGGEMFAFSPDGTIVCLPFIGMEPSVALHIASSWPEFEGMLQNALQHCAPRDAAR